MQSRIRPSAPGLPHPLSRAYAIARARRSDSLAGHPGHFVPDIGPLTWRSAVVTSLLQRGLHGRQGQGRGRLQFRLRWLERDGDVLGQWL